MHTYLFIQCPICNNFLKCCVNEHGYLNFNGVWQLLYLDTNKAHRCKQSLTYIHTLKCPSTVLSVRRYIPSSKPQTCIVPVLIPENTAHSKVMLMLNITVYVFIRLRLLGVSVLSYCLIQSLLPVQLSLCCVVQNMYCAAPIFNIDF